GPAGAGFSRFGEAQEGAEHAGRNPRNHRRGIGAYYFAMRPVMLRIAVGPQNSDDVRVVQTLSQAFSREHGYVRLRPILTDGAIASATALSDGRADLAIIRGDLDVPKNAQAVATLRK